jgi:hypothetical protein
MTWRVGYRHQSSVSLERQTLLGNRLGKESSQHKPSECTHRRAQTQRIQTIGVHSPQGSNTKNVNIDIYIHQLLSTGGLLREQSVGTK